ncbi:MAG: class I SAM-dependent methyltransferase, partial [Vicinamibacterales bacterium]
MTWEADVVSRCVHPSDRVLVVGSGTGRDLLAFAALGCTVTGIEPSPAAAHSRRVLEQHHLNVPVVDGFFEDLTLEGPFDVIVFSWFCYCYIPVSRRRIAVLEKAVALLVPGGRILVSCVVNPVPPYTRLIGLQRVVARATGSDWLMENGDQLRLARPGDPVFTFEHMFVPGEFEREAASAGLRVVFTNREEMMFALQP